MTRLYDKKIFANRNITLKCSCLIIKEHQTRKLYYITVPISTRQVSRLTQLANLLCYPAEVLDLIEFVWLLANGTKSKDMETPTYIEDYL